MKRTHRRFMGLGAIVAALMLVTGLMAAFGSQASAHDDDVSHPAHIHSGTCATLGDVVYPLSNVEYSEDMGSPVADMDSTPMADMMASPMAEMDKDADTSTTTVKASLADLVAGTYAINIHESADKIQNYIACGNITGTPADNMLQVELKELNNSGFSGEAWLTDNGDGTTTVSISLSDNGEGSEAAGTPMADTGSSTNAVSIDIKNFAFSQPSVTVAVGTTVTWTNEDSTAHTVSQVGGTGFESGKIDPGKTFSFTFTTAGSYDYFCQYHANMKGTIVVQ